MLKLSKNTLPNKDLIFSHANGELFWDVEGKCYIDLSSQTLNLLFGQKHPKINQNIIEVLERYTFVDQDFISPDHEAVVSDLSSILPGQLKIFNLRMNDGSSAVECAVKQARRATKKPKVLTVDGIYLGQNSQVIHFRGWGKRPEDLLIGGKEDVVFAPIPYPNYDTPFEMSPNENGEAIANLIFKHRNELGCVILDPIMISSGVTSGRNMKQFLTRAAEQCERYNIPLIFDECQTFGWVPDITLAKHYNIDIDMLVLGKGIGGGFPLSICVSKPDYDNLSFGDADYTNGGNPISIAGLRTTCQLLKDKTQIQHFDKLTLLLQEKLSLFSESNKWVKVRGIGLIRALEIILTPNRSTNIEIAKKIAKIALQNGVYIRTHYNCLTMKPPRIMTIDNARKALDILFDTISIVSKGILN